MTRTRRIYNRKPILGGPGIKAIVIKNWEKLDPTWRDGMLWRSFYTYHPYKQRGFVHKCKCSWCLPRERDRRYLRRRRREVERDLREHYEI